jgi:hypothetical protein
VTALSTQGQGLGLLEPLLASQEPGETGNRVHHPRVVDRKERPIHRDDLAAQPRRLLDISARQPLVHGEGVRLAVAVDRLALDGFEREVRLAIVGHSAIEEPGDAWMLEPGEDLAFGPEAGGGSARCRDPA